MQVSRISLAGVLCLSLLFGCKSSGDDARKDEDTSAVVEPVDTPDEDAGAEQPKQLVKQELDLISEIEQMPPEQRTFKDDMMIVCYSPSRVSQDMQGDERTKELSTYISNNIYTPEAVQFFQEMAVMDVSARDAFFEGKVGELGLTTCPFLDETRRKAPTTRDDVEGTTPSLEESSPQ